MTRPLLTYYGDDFTGSTDALEFLTRAGARSALFLDVPTEETLGRYPDLDAVGVAGATRSLAPDAMEQVLRPALAALRDLGAPHVHYKICSTFDSSPEIGSIGRVIDVAREVFDGPFVPLVVGAPPLGRYCVFGNLFARLGIGTEGQPVRLDRLAAMRDHPVTPMTESDLRVHLAQQTDTPVGLFDILHAALPIAEQRAAIERLSADGSKVVLFDVLYAEQLTTIGELLDGYATTERPLFTVGSSGVEMALGAHWQARGKLRPRRDWQQPGPAGPILVVSGSCSPVTAGQIDWAITNGFVEVALDTPFFATENEFDGHIAEAVASAVREMQAGRSVVVHSCRGTDDPRFTAVAESSRGLTAERLGTALGRIVRDVIERHPVRRLCIAGGDTSSYVARQLSIESLEMIAPLAPGAPLCRATALENSVDALELNVKGGQVGGPDYFAAVQRGCI